MHIFSKKYLNDLISEAKRSSRKRQHRNIHSSFDDRCQRLMNAIGTDSYIAPHRHQIDPKSECLIAAKGLFAAIIFSDILMLPYSLGQKVKFEKNFGPKLDNIDLNEEN